jgi:hypothetical protein
VEHYPQNYFISRLFLRIIFIIQLRFQKEDQLFSLGESVRNRLSDPRFIQIENQIITHHRYRYKEYLLKVLFFGLLFSYFVYIRFPNSFLREALHNSKN